jgi:hypothetical protein
MLPNLNNGESYLSDEVCLTKDLTYKGMELVVEQIKGHIQRNFSELKFEYNGMDSLEFKAGQHSKIKYIFEFSGEFNNPSIDETDLMIYCVDLFRQQ